mmetsp:Transcript_75773/g.173426  ORF Transcript_75773/g.173426 Transcript_75773/m.173426 type:complete len:195 (+) Transcript_75773:77-661(+)
MTATSGPLSMAGDDWLAFVEAHSCLVVVAGNIAVAIASIYCALFERGHCDQPLKLYVIVLMLLCGLDSAWERFRHQKDLGVRRVGNPVAQSSSGARGESLTQLERQHQKEVKKAAAAQRWAVIFTFMTALFFSFMAAQDEDCAMKMPLSYSLIHVFSYLCIARLALFVLLYCYREARTMEELPSDFGGQDGYLL